MIREILFRGKRTDNGEWIEGSLVIRPKDIIGKFTPESGVEWEEWVFNYYIFQEAKDFVCKVIPETVGQFTGLTDKNGKRIFEGDILFSELKKSTSSVFFGKHDIDCCGHCYSSHQSVGFYFSDTGDGVAIADDNEWENLELEVVGNRFDNAELLTAERSDNEN